MPENTSRTERPFAAHRRTAGLALPQAASRLGGISPRYLRRLELGNARLSRRLAERMSQEYGVTIQALTMPTGADGTGSGGGERNAAPASSTRSTRGLPDVQHPAPGDVQIGRRLPSNLRHVGIPEQSAEPGLLTVLRAREFAVRAHAGQRRKSGEPFSAHPLAVVELLESIGADVPTRAAGALHDTVEDRCATLDEIRREFGGLVEQIVAALTKPSAGDARRLGFATREEAYVDVLLRTGDRERRIWLVKLADRLHNMRTLGSLSPQRRQSNALQTLEVFVPLAAAVGLHQWAHELRLLACDELWSESCSPVISGDEP